MGNLKHPTALPQDITQGSHNLPGVNIDTSDTVAERRGAETKSSCLPAGTGSKLSGNQPPPTESGPYLAVASQQSDSAVRIPEASSDMTLSQFGDIFGSKHN